MSGLDLSKIAVKNRANRLSRKSCDLDVLEISDVLTWCNMEILRTLYGIFTVKTEMSVNAIVSRDRLKTRDSDPCTDVNTHICLLKLASLSMQAGFFLYASVKLCAVNLPFFGHVEADVT